MNSGSGSSCASEWHRVALHIAPCSDTPLVDAVRQVDQLAVIVLQAAGAEGLIHALTPQGHGEALLQSQHAQHEELWTPGHQDDYVASVRC